MFTFQPTISVVKMFPDVQLPTYKHGGDSGMDLHFYHSMSWPQVIHPSETIACKTGLRIAIPKGCEGQIRSRSGLAGRGLVVANSPGTIDAGYTGEIIVILANIGTEVHTFYPGDRIAQLVICPVFRANLQEVESLDETSRGDGGFGSTGK